MNEIVDRFLALQPTLRPSSVPETILSKSSDPFDTTKLNLHDSKADFLAESGAVNAALEQSESLLNFLLDSLNEGEQKGEASGRLAAFLDQSVRQSLKSEQIKLPIDLARRNNADIGIVAVSAYVLMDLMRGLRRRTIELHDQERDFWNRKSRAPNHYARTIALRFARLIAQRTGRKPTIGTSKDGDHPSTDFGRALEEIFEVLGVKANFKRAGKWAIDELTEEDLNPPRNALAGMFGMGKGMRPRDYSADIVAALTKGDDQ